MYRKCVAIVVYDRVTRLCLAGRRAGSVDNGNAWQFPQGGVDDCETHEEAARRELFEEMGVRGCLIEKSSQKKCASLDIATCCVANISQGVQDHDFGNFHASYMPSVQFAKKCGPFRYDYPAYVKRQEKGQEQVWFLAFKNESIKNLNVVLNEEFADYAWLEPTVILANVIGFKKDVYIKALSGFGLLGSAA